MEAYQLRVVTEKSDLDERRKKLCAFIESEWFESLPVSECSRLSRQLVVMSDYSNILAQRIEAFVFES